MKPLTELLYCEGNIEGNIRYHTWKNFGGGKIGEFGKSLTICQTFIHQYLQIYSKILNYQNGRTTKVF